MSISFRRMTESDRVEVVSMMRVFYASDALYTNGSEDIFNRDVSACVGDSPFINGYIFLLDGVTAGYGMTAHSFSTEFGKPCVWLEDIYILPEYRHRGIGSAFIDFIKSSFPNSILRLEVEDENIHALNAYKKNGFSTLPYKEMYNSFY